MKPVIRKIIIVKLIFIIICINLLPVSSINQELHTTDYADYAKGEIIVKLEKSSQINTSQDFKISSINDLNNRYGVISVEKIFKDNSDPVLSRYYKLSFPKNTNIIQAIKDYNKDKDIEHAEPNYYFEICQSPNDPRIGEQWALGQLNDCDMDAPEAWDITHGSSNIIIAIIDSGVDYNHIDLSDNIWINEDEIPDNELDDDQNGFIDDIRGWDFRNNDNDPIDDHGHGTHCAGIASAVTNNNEGIAGVSWNSKIMNIKFLDENGGGRLEDGAQAVVYATDNGVNIISMSFGSDCLSESNITLFYDVMNYSYSKGVTLIAGAGNSCNSVKFYPAAYDNVISVTTTNQNDEFYSYHKFGSWVDVAAPGVDILSTLPNNNYGYKTGTSMACPYVAGVAALILSKNPSYSNEKVRQIICSNVDPIDSDYYIGSGRLNAYKALLESNTQPNKPDKPSGSTSNDPGMTYTYTTTAIDLDGDQVYIKFYWGDGTDSGWIGPKNSGGEFVGYKSWSEKGKYEITAISRDENGVISKYSEPLSITTKRTRELVKNPLLTEFINRILNLFFIFQK